MNTRHTCGRLYILFTFSLLITSTSIAAPIHDAAKNNNLTEIQNLIKNNTDKDAKDSDGFSALHYAAQRGNNGIVEVLINGRANKEIQNNNYETPLHSASFAGKYDTVKLLLRLGVKVDAKDYYGYTSLYKAVQSGNLEIVQELLKQGADPEISIGWFWVDSPLKIATNNNRNDIVQEIFFYQGCKGNLQSIQHYLTLNQDINRKDAIGKAFLHHAAMQNTVNTLDLLLTKALDINLQDDAGYTPLHYAAREGHIHAVEKLLRRGANPYIRDNDNKIPLAYAQQKKQKNIEKILKEKANQVSIDDFVGLESVTSVMRGVIQSLKDMNNTDSDSLENLILLYGPPGTGKTMLAKILGQEAGLAFIEVSAASFGSIYMSETGKNLQVKINEARSKAPSILFIDEIDSIVSKRTSREDSASRDNTHTVTTFFKAVDELGKGEKKVLIVCATNHKNDLDPAFLSRCQQKILVPLPRELDRKKIIQKLCSKVPYLENVSDKQYSNFAEKTKGFAGRDLKNLIQGASRIAQRKVLEVDSTVANALIKVKINDLHESLQTQKKSLFDEATFIGDYEVESDTESDDDADSVNICIRALYNSFDRNIASNVQSEASTSSSAAIATSSSLGLAINRVDLLSKTPLHYAAEMGCKFIMRNLLSTAQESQMNLQDVLKTVDKNGNTPLHSALKNGSKTIVKYLLKYNPPMKIVDNEGKIPLALAPTGSKMYGYLLKQMNKPLFDNLVGLETLKAHVKDIESYFANPELFEGLNLKAPRGLLLYGPPGTGKTQAVRALAYHCKATFINKNGTDLQSPQQIKEFFAKARRVAPCIIFIDEFDSIASVRIPESVHHNQMINQLLIELEGFSESNSPLIVIGATNHKATIDPAVRSRFSGNEVDIKLPNTLNRRKILELYIQMHPSSKIENPQLLYNLAASTATEFAGRALEKLVEMAKYQAIRSYLKNPSKGLISQDEDYVRSLADSLKVQMASQSERFAVISQIPPYMINSDQQKKLLAETEGLPLGVIVRLVSKLQYLASQNESCMVADNDIIDQEEYEHNLAIDVSGNTIAYQLLPFINPQIHDDIVLFGKRSLGVTNGLVTKLIAQLSALRSSEVPISRAQFYQTIANILEFPDKEIRYHLIDENLKEVGIQGLSKNIITMLASATEEFNTTSIQDFCFEVKKIKDQGNIAGSFNIVIQGLNELCNGKRKPQITDEHTPYLDSSMVHSALKDLLQRIPHTISSKEISDLSQELVGTTLHRLEQRMFHALHSTSKPLTKVSIEQAFQ